MAAGNAEAAAGSLTLALAGATVVLHPERALEMPGEATVIIADLHLGKATTLRAHGVPVPPGGTLDDLTRLDRVLTRTSADHLVVLGDLVHSRHAWDPRALAPVLAWRRRWPSLAVTLVRGNHDRHAGAPPPALAIRVVDPPFALAGFALHHEPPASPTTPPWLAGHLHPTRLLEGRGRQRVRLPCFVGRGDALLLPAFSSFTGSGAWQPMPDDRAYLIADDTVLPVP